MDAKLLAKIALRVVAVFMIAMGIMALPQIAGMNDPSRASFSALTLIIVLMEAGPVLVGIVLWFLAPILADWMVGDAQPPATAGALDAQTLQAIAFATVGLVVTIQAGAYIAGIGVTAMTSPNDFQVFLHSYVFAAQIIKLVLGLALLVGARAFSRLLLRLREFGLKPPQG